MPFFDRLQEDMGKRFPKPVAPKDGPQPPGRFSFGTQTLGGPYRTDAFGARPAPSFTGLIERYHALIYAMVGRSRDGVTRVPLRLMADGSRVQGKPSRAADPIRVSRSVGKRLARNGAVSTSAVDQVYEIRQHPLLDVLDHPDPYGNFNRKKLIGLMVAYQDVVGSGFLVPEGRGWDWRKSGKIKGPPENLWVVYPHYTIPIRTGMSPQIDHFQYFADWLPFESVIWFRRNVSLRDAYGSAFSPTYASEPYRQQEQELVSVLSQALGIGARPSIIATAKDAMVGITPLQKQAMEQDFNSKYSAYGAGKLHVNDGAWEFTIPDYPKADIAARDIAQHDRDNMANIFGMPPTYFTVDSNLANLQAADVQFARANTEPRCEEIAAQFTRLAQMCDPRLFFAFDPVVQEDEESNMKVVQMRLACGLTTPNQENEEGKWPAFPEGDEHWVPNSLTTMSMLVEQHQQQLEQNAQAMESIGTQDELAVDGQDHQMQMDKEKLKIEGKKAQQKPPAAKRSLDERLESIVASIESELASINGVSANH